MSGAQKQIEKTLEQLHQLVKEAVREEQLIDRLTSLGNDEALSEWMQANIDDGQTFWVAFVEVDRFKSINDQFGYDAADEMLRGIAKQLANAAKSFFNTSATPFRAHGDEFYLGGLGNGEDVIEGLETLRGNIASLKLRPPDKPPDTPDRMRCTVSIGWATSDDCAKSGDVTARSLRGVLEAAVDEAKNERNRVVRFSPEFIKKRMRSGRADCPKCRCKFEIRVPEDDTNNNHLHCPNCGQVGIQRPPSLTPTMD